MTGQMVTLSLTKPQARALDALLRWETGTPPYPDTYSWTTLALRNVIKKLDALNDR